MDSKSVFSSSEKKDAFRIAQGLFESKVLIQRPPTTAQKVTYNAVSSNVPTSHPIRSVKKQKSKRKECIAQQSSDQSWRPFSGEKPLIKDKNKFTEMNMKKRDSAIKSRSSKNQDTGSSDGNSRLPKGVQVFDPWISEDFSAEWIGVDADPNCFILLPCGFDNTSDYLPPLQKPDEPLLQRPEKEVKKYIPPKILHNYNYLENENPYLCRHNRKQVAKVDQSERVRRLRTSEIIKQEIEDLERLLQGYGNHESSSIVIRYQHEITALKEMVNETLRDYNVNEDLPQEEVDDSVIQGDLFELIERHDEIIAAIREKRDACVKELARLGQDLCGNRVPLESS